MADKIFNALGIACATVVGVSFCVMVTLAMVSLSIHIGQDILATLGFPG